MLDKNAWNILTMLELRRSDNPFISKLTYKLIAYKSEMSKNRT